MAYFQPNFTNGTQNWPSYSAAPYVTGFNLTVTGANTLTLSQGAARAFTKNEGIAYIAPSVIAPTVITVNTTTIGPNGCFPIAATLAAPTYDTAFGVYICGSTSGLVNPGQQELLPCAVIATADNFLPAGYDVWRKVGTVIIEAGTSTIKPMTQSGNGNERIYLFNDAYTLVTGGAATTMTEVNLSLQTASYGVLNPAFAEKALLSVSFTADSVADEVILNSASTAPSTAGVVVKATAASQSMIVPVDMPLGVDGSGNAALWYKVSTSDDAATILLAGFTESLGLAAL